MEEKEFDYEKLVREVINSRLEYEAYKLISDGFHKLATLLNPDQPLDYLYNSQENSFIKKYEEYKQMSEVCFNRYLKLFNLQVSIDEYRK